MNKIYYPLGVWYPKEEKDKFYDALKKVQEKSGIPLYRYNGDYIEYYYSTKDGELYKYEENDAYGTPYSLEQIPFVYGVNINCDEYNFLDLISRILKTVETRNKPTLRKYVGQRVALVQTRPSHNERAKVIGYATISEEIIYNNAVEFYNDPRHCITKDMKTYRFSGIKYGYVLTDFKKAEKEKMIYTNGIRIRKVEME